MIEQYMWEDARYAEQIDCDPKSFLGVVASKVGGCAGYENTYACP